MRQISLDSSCPSNRKAGFGSLKSSMGDRNQKELQSKFCVRKEKINSCSMKYISRLKNKSKKVTVIRLKTMRLRKLRSLLHHVLVQKEAMGTTTPTAEPFFFFFFSYSIPQECHEHMIPVHFQ